MRTSNDPDLNMLARELDTLVWLNPLTAEQEAECREATFIEIGLNNGDRAPSVRRLVHPLPGSSHWSVRMYLGGGQRTLGVVKHENVSAAFRYADMAQQHFWRYKVRAAHPPAPCDLNFDPKKYEGQLEYDMKFEENALDLLRRQEEYLLRMGILKTSIQRSVEEKEARAMKRRGFLRATVQVNHMELCEKYNALADQLAESMKECVNAVEKAVTTLTTRIDQQDASLGKVLTKVIQDLSALKVPRRADAIGTAPQDVLPSNPITIS